MGEGATSTLRASRPSGPVAAAELGRSTPSRAEEAARLRALARYAVLDTPRNAAFDDIVELARAVTGAPVAGIGFLDRDRVWFKSIAGLDVEECSRAEYPGGCPGTPWEFHGDATMQTWLPGGGPHNGADFNHFASASFATSDGYLLGHLFIMDRRHVRFEDRELTLLASLAQQVIRILEHRRTVLAYHTVVDGGGRVVFHADEDNRLVSVTPAWSQLTGYGAVRSVGRRLQDFVHEEDRQHFVRELAEGRAREGLAAPLECRLRRLVGDDVPVEIVVRPWADERGRRWGVIGLIADITERKSREVETQHAQRLESLGRLAAGLAHEINTPIQFVGDNTRFLAQSCEAMLKLILTYRSMLDVGAGALSWPERQDVISQAEEEADVNYLSEEVPSAVTQSLDGVERVASLVRAMKTFSHPGRDAQAAADLNEALEATLTVARNQIRYLADVDLRLGALPPVTCHVADLNQVFLNMVVNAADAIEDTGSRGRITVETQVDGDDALITISDTGAGIPEAIQRKIFEPFFTTKDVGRGTGQGLSLAWAVVVDKHGGALSVTSQVGVGTTFTIRLPIAGRQPETGTPA